ncbi:hypothetical protein BGX26_007651, partial [Mortierella sp. AD094]
MAEERPPAKPQALRPMYSGISSANSSSLTETVNIESHYNMTGENVIIWDDVLTAFQDASYIQNAGTILSFLRNENLEV